MYYHYHHCFLPERTLFAPAFEAPPVAPGIGTKWRSRSDKGADLDLRADLRGVKIDLNSQTSEALIASRRCLSEREKGVRRRRGRERGEATNALTYAKYLLGWLETGLAQNAFMYL